MTFRGISIPPELSINSIAAELEAAGLARMGQGVNPDDVVGLLLLTPQLLNLLGGLPGDAPPGMIEGPLPSPRLRSVRLEELEGVAEAVAGGGGAENITLEAPSNVRIVQVMEVIGDSDSPDFNIDIFEDADRTRLNRIFRNVNIANHLVDRLLEGQDYRDRDSLAGGQTDRIYVRVTNNDAAPHDIIVRVKFRVEPAEV